MEDEQVSTRKVIFSLLFAIFQGLLFGVAVYGLLSFINHNTECEIKDGIHEPYTVWKHDLDGTPGIRLKHNPWGYDVYIDNITMGTNTEISCKLNLKKGFESTREKQYANIPGINNTFFNLTLQ